MPDEELLMLADILPTAYEVGVLNGNVQPGDVIAVVGSRGDPGRVWADIRQRGHLP